LIFNKNVSLLSLKLENANDLSTLANNKRVWDNLRDYMPFPYTLEDAQTFIEANKDLDPPLAFGIHFQNDFCGVIGINQMKDVYSHSAEIGYWLGEPFWGQGIMSEAVSLMIKHCFNELNIIRICTGVFDYNKASVKVLEKNGFEYEGSFKLGVQKNGKLVDELRYGLINPKHLQLSK